MERRRALMIDTRNGQAVDPDWRPMLAIEELPAANTLMAKNNLHYVWRWIPETICIQGSALLDTQ